MRKQRFSKQRTIRAYRIIPGLFEGYPASIGKLWQQSRQECTFLPRTLVVTPLFVIFVVVITFGLLCDALDNALDPVRCLIHGVPPPPSPEEREKVMLWMDQTNRRLNRMVEAVEGVRRENRRILDAGKKQ